MSVDAVSKKLNDARVEMPVLCTRACSLSHNTLIWKCFCLDGAQKPTHLWLLGGVHLDVGRHTPDDASPPLRRDERHRDPLVRLTT